MELRSVDWYIAEAKARLAAGDPSDAIWLLENAVHGTTRLSNEERRLTDLARVISDEELDGATSEAESELQSVLHMLQHPTGMIGEEWMLILGRLSVAHCIRLLTGRIGRERCVPLLGAAMQLLGEATDNFSDVEFRNALAELRSRYPNPLPPPL